MYCRSRSGKLDPEYAAGADTAFDADGATHQLDQLLGHHQSDAGVLDAHPYPAYVGHHHALDDDYAPDLVVLDRIRQQVDDHLLDPGFIAANREWFVETRKYHLDVPLLRLRQDHCMAVFQHIGERH